MPDHNKVIEEMLPLMFDAGFLKYHDSITALVAERNALKEQRDEANAHLRDACVQIATGGSAYQHWHNKHTAKEIAKMYGWKCFEEEDSPAA